MAGKSWTNRTSEMQGSVPVTMIITGNPLILRRGWMTEILDTVKGWSFMQETAPCNHWLEGLPHHAGVVPVPWSDYKNWFPRNHQTCEGWKQKQKKNGSIQSFRINGMQDLSRHGILSLKSIEISDCRQRHESSDLIHFHHCDISYAILWSIYPKIMQQI